MPTLYMLCGTPASGKSTWLQKQDTGDAVVLSTDNYVQSQAVDGKTYNDVFKDTIKSATASMYDDLQFAIDFGKDIYWDQTNLSVKSRSGKLNQLPEQYEKVAVVFPTPDEDTLSKRLKSRPGKTIPGNVMNSMINSFEMPTLAEGFHQIEVVR